MRDECVQAVHAATLARDQCERVAHVPHGIGGLVARGERVVARGRLARSAPQRLCEDGLLLRRGVGKIREPDRAADLRGVAETVADGRVGRRLDGRAQRLRTSDLYTTGPYASMRQGTELEVRVCVPV